MPRSPIHSFRTVLKILHKHNFHVLRQRGSHIFLSDGQHYVAVPHHKEIEIGTLLSIIDQSGLKREVFMK